MKVTFYQGLDEQEVGAIELIDGRLIGSGVGEQILQDPPTVIQPGTLAVFTAATDPVAWLENLPALYRTPYAQAALTR